MGDQAIFTDEELVVLGEKEPAEAAQAPPASDDGEKPPEGGATPPEGDGLKQTPPAGEQPEHTEEEKNAAEAMGFRVEGKFIVDADGTKIPVTRWKKLYFEHHEAQRGKAETERKFNLFKELGADRYYEIYPEDKPEGYQPPQPKPASQQQTQEQQDYGNMIVRGGEYDGQTLNEVYQINPAYATQLLNGHLDGQRRETETRQQQEEKLKSESVSEINAFTGQLSKELYSKEADKLTADEERKVADTIKETLAWMSKTRRGGGVIADAYFLMNREKDLSDAKTKGGREALEALKKGGGAPSSIGGGTGAALSGFSAYEAMTADQLAEVVDRMSEKKAMEFLKDAPQSLKEKHPGLPWT